MIVRMPEAELQRNVLECAAWLGWRLRYHTHYAIKSVPGFPDLVLVRPPRLLFVELKSERGRLKPPQAEWLDGLRSCPGIETYCWRPADWCSGEVEKVLR